MKAARRRERPARPPAADPAFAGVDLDAAVDPAALIGRSPEQVDEFLAEVVAPIRKKFPSIKPQGDELHV